MARLMEANITELPPASAVVAMAVAVVVGLLYCLAGYRVFHFLVGLTGFLLAGAVAAALAGWLGHGRLVLMAAGLALGGIAGAFALCFLYRVGVFCLGLLGGVAVAQAVLVATGPESWAPWAVVGAGLVGGLIARWLERPVMVVATAAIGACVAVHGAVLLAGAAGLQEVLDTPAHQTAIQWAVSACCAALALTGVATQFIGFKGKPSEDDRGHKAS